MDTVSWNLKINFPEPFHSFVTVFNFTRLDFPYFKCLFSTSKFTSRCLALSAIPIIVVIVSYFVLAIRLEFIKRSEAQVSGGRIQKLIRNHSFFALLVGYLVLPTVAQVQFSALKCISVSGQSLLYQDTSENCHSIAYKSFYIVNMIFVLVYQSVPLVWFVLLWRSRKESEDQVIHIGKATAPQEGAVTLTYTSFLWRDYKPELRYFEIYEVYKRMFMSR
jgi:hypothetical protein